MCIYNNDMVKRLVPLIKNKISQVNSIVYFKFEIYKALWAVYFRGDKFLPPKVYVEDSTYCEASNIELKTSVFMENRHKLWFGKKDRLISNAIGGD